MPGTYFDVPLLITFAITFGIVPTGRVICALKAGTCLADAHLALKFYVASAFSQRSD